MNGETMTRRGGDKLRPYPPVGGAQPRKRNSRVRRGLVSVGFLTAMLLGSTSPLAAQEMPAPVPTQLSIILRVFAFDRNFEPDSPGEIVVGLLYQPNLRESVRAMTEMVNAVEASGAGPTGETLRAVPIPFESGSQLQGAMSRQEIDVLYITPLRAVNFGILANACQAIGVPSATGVPEYVERGIALGIGARGGRPNIMINVEAAKSMGSDFSSELLKLAEIVQGLQDSRESDLPGKR